MEILNQYFELQKQVHEYFGYTEEWVTIPLDDSTEMFWFLDGEGPGFVHFAETEEALRTKSGQYFVSKIYTQRFLPKWVYRGKDYTMVAVDTQCDGNKFLQVFDNTKERPDIIEGGKMINKSFPEKDLNGFDPLGEDQTPRELLHKGYAMLRIASKRISKRISSMTNGRR